MITWDDWGGYYDHKRRRLWRRTGSRLGFRVPMILLSPYAHTGIRCRTRARPLVDPGVRSVPLPPAVGRTPNTHELHGGLDDHAERRDRDHVAPTRVAVRSGRHATRFIRLRALSDDARGDHRRLVRTRGDVPGRTSWRRETNTAMTTPHSARARLVALFLAVASIGVVTQLTVASPAQAAARTAADALSILDRRRHDVRDRQLGDRPLADHGLGQVRRPGLELRDQDRLGLEDQHLRGVGLGVPVEGEADGLAPNTQYCYRVYLGTTDLLGSDATPQFWSAIPSGSNASYSFAVFGDWGDTNQQGTTRSRRRSTPRSGRAACGSRSRPATPRTTAGASSTTAI
jgi:hypothetical protein